MRELGRDFIQFTDKVDFAARVGFAWRPFGSRKLAVRSHYGMFYIPLTGRATSAFARFPVDQRLASRTMDSIRWWCCRERPHRAQRRRQGFCRRITPIASSPPLSTTCRSARAAACPRLRQQQQVPDIQGPGLANVDFSMIRNFRAPLREGMRFELRGAFFNLFNHTNLSAPGGAFGRRTSGALPARACRGRFSWA